MSAEIDHINLIQRMEISHEARIIRTLQELEDQIFALAIQAPQDNGKLFDLTYAISSRQAIQQAITQTYLTEADAIIREYPQAVEAVRQMFQSFGSAFSVSPQIISSLQRISFQGFEDIAVTFQDELSNSLYQNTLVGRPAIDAIKELRQSINGVYIQSDEDEIRRLVNIANSQTAESEEAVRKLHQIYASDRTGQNMRKYATQMVTDSLRQFDATVVVTAGNEGGTEKWIYYGSLKDNSRQHCIDHFRKVMTEDEIRQIWSSKNWKGKAQGDPFIVRGGYNCRHHFRPYFEDA